MHSIKRAARKEAWYGDSFNPFRKTTRSSTWQPDGGFNIVPEDRNPQLASNSMLAPNELGLDLPGLKGPGRQEIRTCSILRTKVDTARECVLQLRSKIQEQRIKLSKLHMRVHEETKALFKALNNLMSLELTNDQKRQIRLLYQAAGAARDVCSLADYEQMLQTGLFYQAPGAARDVCGLPEYWQMLQIGLFSQAAGAARDECGLAAEELDRLELELDREESELEQAEIKFYNEIKREHFNVYTQSTSQHKLALLRLGWSHQADDLALYPWESCNLRKVDVRIPVPRSMPLDDRQSKSLVDVYYEDDREKILSPRASGTNKLWLPNLSALLLVFISIPLILPPTVAAAEIPNTTVAAIRGATNADADSLKEIFIRKGISLLVILWEAVLFFIVAGLCFLAYKLTLVKGGRLWSAALMFILMTVSCFIREVQDVSTGVLLGLAVGGTGFAFHTYITGIKQLKHGSQVLEHGVIYLIFGALFGVAILFFGWPYLESTTTQHWDVYTLPSIVLAFTIFEAIAIMIELVMNIRDDSPDHGHGQPQQHGVNRGQTLPTPVSYPTRPSQGHTRV